jgi:hypothetical protein
MTISCETAAVLVLYMDGCTQRVTLAANREKPNPDEL